MNAKHLTSRRAVMSATVSLLAGAVLPSVAKASTLSGGGGAQLIPFNDGAQVLSELSFDPSQLFFSKADIESIHRTPTVATIRGVINRALPYLPSLLQGYGYALNDDGHTLALVAFLAHELRPYGTGVFAPTGVMTLDRLLASSLLECRSYSDLTALMFKALRPQSSLRLFHVSWRNSGFGGHNQLWAEGCGAPNGLLVDPTFGMIGTVPAQTFDRLRAGDPLKGLRIRSSPYWGQSVAPTLQSLPLRPSNVLAFVDTSCYFRNSGETLNTGLTTKDANVWFDRVQNAVYVLATSGYNAGAYFPRGNSPIFCAGGIAEFFSDNASPSNPYVTNRQGTRLT